MEPPHQPDILRLAPFSTGDLPVSRRSVRHAPFTPGIIYAWASVHTNTHTTYTYTSTQTHTYLQRPYVLHTLYILYFHNTELHQNKNKYIHTYSVHEWNTHTHTSCHTDVSITNTHTHDRHTRTCVSLLSLSLPLSLSVLIQRRDILFDLKEQCQACRSCAR